MLKLYYQKDPFSQIAFGFMVHLLARIALEITQNQIIYAFIGLIGWYFIIYGFTKFKAVWKVPFKRKYRFIFYLYILLCIITIIRGYLIDYPYQWISLQGLINFHLFNPIYILPYLMPLIILIPVRYYNFKLLVKYSVFISVITLVLFFIFNKEIVASSGRQAAGLSKDGDYGLGSFIAQFYANIAIIVLLKKYTTSKIWLLNSWTLLTSIVINLITARRGSVAISASLFLFNIYFYILTIRAKYRIISIIGVLALIITCVTYFHDNKALAFIKERGLEDTRSGVDKALLNQMTTTDLIWGKGLNGRYYYPLLEDDYLKGWRYGSETGFYSIILRGGYVMVILYIFLLAYPAFLGIFKSKNLFCKAIGFYILLSLIELYPFGLLSFNLKFMIIWMGVLFCYTNKIRRMSDYQIKKYYF